MLKYYVDMTLGNKDSVYTERIDATNSLDAANKIVRQFPEAVIKDVRMSLFKESATLHVSLTRNEARALRSAMTMFKAHAEDLSEKIINLIDNMEFQKETKDNLPSEPTKQTPEKPSLEEEGTW